MGLCGSRSEKVQIHFVNELESTWNIHSAYNVKKSPELINGLRSLQHLTYRPHFMSCRRLCGGHCQTIQIGLRHKMMTAYIRDLYNFYEDYTHEDGGTNCLNFRGEFSADSKQPIIVVIPGVNSHGQVPEVRSLVEQLTDAGFSVVVISHRGVGFDPEGKPALLKSGRIFSGTIKSDFIGPATYINEKYG